ncbi:MAG: efflux RND transporter permease subunit [Thiomicrospira sp.]|nr:efflux RND transporter permease subunit [Thiomicrospira sp.]PIQ06233.1 MAG: MFS transporter [Piscirickettsiaceae bacterium CG18_big_fil_WC_8_21_14_2_50_44_103]NCN65855.1 efflux RND transporter permease subunit [Thiomicrospira sp.]NCO14881.1 efflux RND transporter permease subunit [Thiomicrospira sp.]NCO80647.1 efflux RND transporter permease subunit [Thiomicrospira sp.]
MMQRWNLSEWAVKHQAITLYFILLSLLVGTFSFINLGRAEDPTFTIKVMVVSAKWPGATAEQMQMQVADHIEKKLQEVKYFDFVETTARPGSVTLLINFKDYTPADQVQDQFYQVRKRMLDLQGSLPQGVQGPFVNDDFSDVYFTLYSLTPGQLDYRQWLEVAEKTRDGLLRVEGVQKVNLLGEQPQQIQIEFHHHKLAQLALTQAQILHNIAAYQTIAPAGFIETDGPRIYLRPQNGIDDLAQLRQIPIAVGDQVLHLGDLASIQRGFVRPSDLMIRNQGEDTLLLGVVMKSGQNGLALSDRLNRFATQWQTQLADGVALQKVTNQGDAISLAVNAFQIKFLMAVAVVLLVSFIALGMRAGIVVALAIPLTLALTFFLMMLTGKNLDRITLGALILALGLLVDDAIIAIEMMLVKMEEGLERTKAAAYAWTVTASPMLFGTLVTVVGFVPIGFAASNVGEYAGNIFWILAFSLLLSWLVAVTFTPYLGYKFLPDVAKNAVHSADAAPDNAFSRRLSKWVHGCVRYRKTVVLLTLSLFVLSVIGMAKLVEKQFFPSSDRPELMVDIYLPEGSSQQVTNQLAHQIEAYVHAQPEVKTLTSYVGQGAPRFFLALNPELPNPAFAKLIIVTENAEKRNQLKARLQSEIESGRFNAARVRVHALLYGPPVIWPVTFRVEGGSVEQLTTVAEQVRQVMVQNTHIRDPHLEWGEQSPEIQLDYDSDRLALLGVTPLSLSQQLQQALRGETQAVLREGSRQILLTSFSEQRAQDLLASLNALPIETQQGDKLPLQQIARLAVVFTDPVLKRRNRTPYLNVNAEVVGAQPPDVTLAIWQDLQPLMADLPQGVRLEIGGSVEQSGKAQASIRVLMPLMVLLMITMVMLNMQSFSGTFMVLVTAPLGMIGAVAALLLFSQPFGFVATLGLIGLAGILMRNTLILVGQIHDNQKQGMQGQTALIDATLRRSRPVLLTALAAMLAFIPLTTNTFWGPLAYVLIGGIGVGTLLTLLFLPALYAIWFRLPKV